GNRSGRMVTYSTRIDAADFSDGQQTCCRLPLRWGTVAFGTFFAAAGFCQLLEQVFKANGWTLSGINLFDSSSTTLTLFTLAVCMILSGVSGVLGGFFEVRLPVTFFALMLLCQCLLEVIWFFLEDKTGLSGICSMIWDEVMLGGRSTNNITATNLFYSFLSIDVHLWAFGVAASYEVAHTETFGTASKSTSRSCAMVKLALQLRIAGKTIWFEPFDDEEDDDGSAIIKGEPSGYGATGDVGSSHDTGPSRAEP
ncbi:unnamed protein product, partial [Durusdinium trenchii]